MTRSKKIFVALGVLFFIFLLLLIYDISRKTTFPGPKSRPKKDLPADADTVKHTSSPKSAFYPLLNLSDGFGFGRYMGAIIFETD